MTLSHWQRNKKFFGVLSLTSLSVLIWLVLSHEPDGEPDHIEGAHRVHHLNLMDQRIVTLDANFFCLLRAVHHNKRAWSFTRQNSQNQNGTKIPFFTLIDTKRQELKRIIE
jgi:hypothetical protein